jgi:tagatose-6-phosphate ketose/aldose isomerase
MDHPASRSVPPHDEIAKQLEGPVDGWLTLLGSSSVEAGILLSASASQQHDAGYRHTLREISQQPVTWVETAAHLAGHIETFDKSLLWVAGEGVPAAIVLTGSGSSVYVGECLSPVLQPRLGIPVQAVSAGELLIHPRNCLPPRGRTLLVSFARSGNSPESCGVLDSVRDTVPQCRHLIVTCNRHGRLATSYGDDPRVGTVVLDDKTCDRSLVMTSSFTNMALAGRLLGMTQELAAYQDEARLLARAGAEILLQHMDALARVARSSFRSAIFLGTGARFGAAREGALKMLEMTGGRVLSFPETYLGLRHGPMCAVDDGALLVCFLARDPVTRAYEVDLIHELNRKRLGARKVIVGSEVPEDLVGKDDLVVETPALQAVSDGGAPILDVLVGQLLAFFRCLHSGLRPDMPSAEGVINRVVEDFVIHRRG